MTKSIKYFIAAWCVFVFGNFLQIFVHVPLMMAWGNQRIMQSFGGGFGLFWAIQATQAPLFAAWCVTGVLFILGVRADLREVKP